MGHSSSLPKKKRLRESESDVTSRIKKGEEAGGNEIIK
jgi:hypothetical protein